METSSRVFEVSLNASRILFSSSEMELLPSTGRTTVTLEDLDKNKGVSVMFL